MPANDTKLSERIDAALQRECAASLVPYGQEPPREKRIAVIEGVLAEHGNVSLRANLRYWAEIERLRAAIRDMMDAMGNATMKGAIVLGEGGDGK